MDPDCTVIDPEAYFLCRLKRCKFPEILNRMFFKGVHVHPPTLREFIPKFVLTFLSKGQKFVLDQDSSVRSVVAGVQELRRNWI